MPEEGFESVTISKPVHDLLKELAEEESRSLANMAELAIKVYANRVRPKKAGK